MDINTVMFAAMDFGRRLGASDPPPLRYGGQASTCRAVAPRRRRVSRRGSVRSEQQRLRPKDMPPGGLRPIWPMASLRGPSSIAADTLGPARPALRDQIGRKNVTVFMPMTTVGKHQNLRS